MYLEGDYRFQRIRKGTRSLIYLWAQKEFKNLQTAFSVGVTVPRPILVRGNVLVMQFIGEKGVSAPLMKDIVTGVTVHLYQRLLKEVKLLYRKAELVHADLSEYNVMMWKQKPVMIDMSQAVSISHPLSDVFLKRDLGNLNNFFLRHSIEVRPIDDLHSWVIGKDAD